MPKKYILEGIQLEFNDEMINKISEENKHIKIIDKKPEKNIDNSCNLPKSKDKKESNNKHYKKKKQVGDIIELTQLVSMTKEEYDDLINTYGKEITDKCIKTLHNYKKTYKKSKSNNSDYKSIKIWVIDTVKQRMKFWKGN